MACGNLYGAYMCPCCCSLHISVGRLFHPIAGPLCKTCIGQASIYVKFFPPHFCLICKPGVLVVPASRVVGRTKSINICKVFRAAPGTYQCQC